MKLLAATIILLVGLILGYWFGHSRQPLENYQQDFDSELSQATLFIMVETQLGSGKTDAARREAMIRVYTALDFLRFLQLKGKAHPSIQQKQEWNELAKKTLAYMLQHEDECDSRLLTVQAGVRGLQGILTEPEDVRRLSELTNDLASVEKKIPAKN